MGAVGVTLHDGLEADSGLAEAVGPGDRDDQPPCEELPQRSLQRRVGVETTAQLVWILASRLPEPRGRAGPD
jgi:hypothetical protein